MTSAEKATPGPDDLPVLELESVSASYGQTPVLRELNLSVSPGTVVALLGPNGIGKTTTLRVAAGLLSPDRGRVMVGGQDLTRLAPNKRAAAGLCLIPEGRGIFRGLTVAENLRLHAPKGMDSGAATEIAVDAFPVLGKRLSQLAGKMSGGEQQMLALARAYVCQPKVVLLDEVSMGLSPLLVDQVFDAIKRLAAAGIALLIVEQYVNRAMAIADKVVLLGKGEIAFVGPPSDLDQDRLVEHYLGSDKPQPLEEAVLIPSRVGDENGVGDAGDAPVGRIPDRRHRR
ncbi:ABC transporter ATP-binding protein [Jatrophihabitans sp.]|uniref:ABC transporter ATP-binding protein n=1 Tax=Jatrophihabitans sp. TaxID=1932789 RepID=UPI0030C6F7ED|nr:transporter related protein [Jatrophihabitans sp.]